jgi:hypothetical protein
MLLTRADYQAFTSLAPADFPLFMYDWYLDAVCVGGTWQAVGVEKNGHLVAVWPFFLKEKWGQRYVTMPPLGRLMGPYVVPDYRPVQREMGVLEELLEQLPAVAAWSQDFPYTAANWLPLHWRGFRQTTRYSYQLALGDREALWRGVIPTYRNNKIPKAAARLEVRTGDDLGAFLDVHNRSFTRQGLRPPVSFEFLERLDRALAERQRRAIFFARDRSNGAVHSVVYLTWDAGTAYYLLAGDDPALRASGSGIFIAWEAIGYVNDALKLPYFDFAGSMIAPIERVRRQFGAAQRPYFRLENEWSWLWRMRRRIF